MVQIFYIKFWHNIIGYILREVNPKISDSWLGTPHCSRKILLPGSAFDEQFISMKRYLNVRCIWTKNRIMELHQARRKELIMISAKYAALILATALAILGTGALAQQQGGTVVYMGDLNQLVPLESSAASRDSVQFPGEPAGAQAIYGTLNNSSTNTSAINVSTINASIMNTSSKANLAPIAQEDSSRRAVSVMVEPQALGESSGKEVLDLTRYSADRANKNLTGYTNIMYPITGSRGTTASTSGGGGGGGGCGCG